MDCLLVFPPLLLLIAMPYIRKSTLDRLRVIQENIELVTDPDLIPEDLFFMAGKFFKRFDRASCKFVSNIKEMYPDD